VCLFLFDILYVDGKVVMNEPLKKRRQILEVRAPALAPHTVIGSSLQAVTHDTHDTTHTTHTHKRRRA
jgi:ATP-dependent DNA ligase